ncbi:hypothetical protein J3R30DRAFT_3583508 [Lentinula aciculospora]|uniref:Uncharacterized protein n=1 Tax=Lentinula aciculospora TaxID=153920 RepID=A0A9W8ZVK7_9AGAR|nr:hypothetical protein J3R30DRAFT_3583508 [Lentinula aciculospora]
MTVLLGWDPELGMNREHLAMDSEDNNQLSSHTSPSRSPRRQYPVKVEERTPPPIQFPLEPDEEPEAVIFHGWRHPAELQYYAPEDWSQTKIIHYLIANAFSVPSRPTVRGAPFFLVTGINGENTRLPIGYRIPLMFLARFQWLSLKLVLTASSRETEWAEYKFSILHVSRLCSSLLSAAQDYVKVSNEEGVSKGMDRKWRCPTFDRALVRYRLKWFISNPSQVEEFWRTFQEDQYTKDTVKFDWRRWALKGYRGFMLTEVEITNGITAEQFLLGLKQKNDEWFWDTEEEPVLNGIDAWSLKTLALSVSTPANEHPTTYSQSPPVLVFPAVSKPVTPPVSSSSRTETVTNSPRPDTESAMDSNTNILAPSNSVPSSTKDYENESKSGRSPANDTRSSHSTSDVLPLPPWHSSVFLPSTSNATSSQKPNSRKRPGSPLAKKLKNTKRGLRDPTLTSTLVNGKRGKDTSADKSIRRNTNREDENSSDLLYPEDTSDCSNGTPSQMLVDELSPTLVPRISAFHLAQSRPLSNDTPRIIVPSSKTATSGPSSISSITIPHQQVLLPPTPVTASPYPYSLSHPGNSGYTYLPYSVYASASSRPPSTAHSYSPSLLQSISPPSGGSLSPEIIIEVIDSIFAGFAESLSKFSDEIRQAKAESVAEIRESLIATFLNRSPNGRVPEHLGSEGNEGLEDLIRDVVRDEMRKTVREEPILKDLKKDIIDATQREVRDGVRILVATIRSEVVGSENEVVSAKLEQIVNQNREIARQLADLRHGFGKASGTRSTEQRYRRTADNGKRMELDRGTRRIDHPLQHLLGEPEEAEAEVDEEEEQRVSIVNAQKQLAFRACTDVQGSSPFDHGNDNASASSSCPIPANDVLPFRSRRKLGF